ncbi:MAG: flagellar hook-length control protein FliK [Devosia sp.]
MLALAFGTTLASLPTDYCVFEAALSPHLTVSYATAPLAGNAPAGGATLSASPLGFLSALVDQLLTGSEAGIAPALGVDTSADFAALLPTATEVSVTAPADAPAGIPQLLGDLTDALAALDEALETGAPADPDLVDHLDDAVTALAVALGIQPPAPAPAPVPVTEPAVMATPPALAISTVLDPLAATSNTTPAAPPADEPALPALAALNRKLIRVSQLARAEVPALAEKLTALGARLSAAAPSTPELFAQLAAAEGPAGVELDALIQAALDKTAGAQLSVPLALKTPPAAAVPAAAIPAAVTQAVVLDADPASAALKLSVAVTSREPVSPSKSEVKITDTAELAPSRPDTAPPAAPAPAAAPNAAARAVHTAYQPVAAQAAALPQLAFEMVRQFHQGQSRFTIRLDPPELGRVDVKMHVDASGTVHARLTVERAETLDMFQRDQRVLERALVQAGLDGSKTNLEFALKQNPFSGMMHDGRQQPGAHDRLPVVRGPIAEADTAIPSITLYRGTASAGGVNLFV